MNSNPFPISKPFQRLRWCHLFGLVIVLAAGNAWSQSLVYEREFSFFESADNVLRISVSADKQLIIERPEFMTRSGLIRMDTSPELLAELERAFSTASAQASRASADVLARAEVDMKFVSDPEISRFYRTDSNGRKQEQVSAVSISAWLEHYPDDPGLQTLNDLEQRWLAVMTNALAQEEQQ